MSFISVLFLLFLALTASVFYGLPARFRNSWLLFAGYLFYFTWQPAFLIVLVCITLLSFQLGKKIAVVADADSKKRWLTGSVITLLLPFAFFKYFNFLNENIANIFSFFSFDGKLPNQPYLIPLGLSFFTFQAISYVVDIYRGYLKPEERIEKFAVYMAFFPTLLAGPIERAKSILGQLSLPVSFEYQNVRAGLQLILWGVFKKVVIADRLSEVINPVFAKPEDFPGILIYIVVCALVFQIFCDFSGYSDIAVGTARIFGIQLSKNFDDRVYAATSRTQFWQGWHISLTSWLRDYVFFPLSKGVRNRGRMYLNIIVVYLLVGVWHGASWGFVVWGLLNGGWLVMENATKNYRAQLFKSAGINTAGILFNFFSWALVFHVGAFFLVFAKTRTPLDAFAFLSNLLNSNGGLLGRPETMSLALTAIFIALMDLVNRKIPPGLNFDEFIGKQAFWFRWVMYFILAQMIMRYIQISDPAMFNYFRF